MTPILPRTVLALVTFAALPLVPALGQLTSFHWNGEALTTATADWENDFNWLPLGYPNSPTALAVFDDTSVTTNNVDDGTRTAFAFTGFNEENPANVDIAGILLAATNPVGRGVRNRSGTATTPTFGYLTIHGYDDTVESEAAVMLLRNDSLDSTLRFGALNDNARLNIRMVRSGVIHVEHPEAAVRIGVPMVEMDDPVTITKTGDGMLIFGIDRSANVGRNETTGGLIVKGGTIVLRIGSTQEDGVVRTSPFGHGAVTFHDGTAVHSNTDANRTIHNPMSLEGTVRFGSPDPVESGSITFSDFTPDMITLLSDVTVDSQTITLFNKSVIGDFRITKVGPERLTLAGENNTFRAVTIQDGNATFNGTDNGQDTLPALPGELMPDQFVIDGGVFRLINFDFTLEPTRGITITANGGGIETSGGRPIGTQGPMIDADPENPGAIFKDGTGWWIIHAGAVASFRGPTRIDQGGWAVDGVLEHSAVEALSGTRVSGSGVYGAGFTVRNGAEFYAGGIDSVGVTRAHAPVLLEAGSTATFRLENRTAASRLQAHAGLNFDGTDLAIELLHQPVGGDVHVLVENAGDPASLVGAFYSGGSPLGEGDTFTVENLVEPEVTPYVQEFLITYAYNGGGYQNSIAIIATGGAPPPPGDYASWREAYFGDPNDPAGDPLAQPVGQPVANLLFHAIGLDLAVDPATALPQAVGEQAIRFTRRTPLASRLVVEGTSGHPGGAWDELAVLESGATSWTGSAIVSEEPIGGDLIQTTVTDTTVVESGVRLLRLRATLP